MIVVYTDNCSIVTNDNANNDSDVILSLTKVECHLAHDPADKPLHLSSREVSFDQW
jgi:hypothetical protein